MRKLFRSFERSGLEYLLVSGQASVLYGASTFSEDVDIWIRPTAGNARRLLRALAERRARVYKLTPPLTERFLRSGHGFHFLVPGSEGPIYLDVMGRPPRVGPFSRARRRARILRTGWGGIPVVAPEDLVELKKTRRLSDYEVITHLARIRLEETGKPAKALLRWAARNSFTIEPRAEVLRRLGQEPDPGRLRRAVAREIAEGQRRDAAYWRPILRSLRRLRRSGGLLPEGRPVAALLRSSDR